VWRVRTHLRTLSPRGPSSVTPGPPPGTPGFSPAAKRDGNAQLATFAETLERVVVETVEAGYMTKDLALLVGDQQGWLTTEGFLDKVAENLTKAMKG